MSQHINTQGERVAIEPRKMHGVTPVHCLVIYDDAPPMGTGRPAPMLLDAGTREWLKAEIAKIESEEVSQ